MKEIIATLATDAGVSVNSFKKWKQRQAVPHKYRLALIDLAEKRGAKLTAEDFNWKDTNGHKPKKRRAA